MALAVAVWAAANTAEAAPRRIGVGEIRAEAGADQATCNVIAELLQGEIGARGIEVVSHADVKRQLEFAHVTEAMAGCTGERCYGELADALQVDEIVFGSVSRVGSSYLLTPKRARRTQGGARAQASRELSSTSHEHILEALVPLVDRLFGPRPRPSWPWVSCLVLGLGSAGATAYFGVQTLDADVKVEDADVAARRATIGAATTASLLTAAGGLWLWQRAGLPGDEFAVLPHPRGVLVVGRF